MNYPNPALLLFALSLSNLISAAPEAHSAAWSPVADSMLTEWGESLDPGDAWSEYPRPQMKREEWTSLNGLWDYAIVAEEADKPKDWEGKALVPFALEAPLSGVGTRLQSDEALWYRRSFDLAPMPTAKLLLHFEAVDYHAQVWVNGKQVGEHVGGNLPFSFEISSAIKAGQNELLVKVIDKTDASGLYQLRGKQRQENQGIWYTPVSGIWQTVWLEAVPDTYIETVRLLGSMDGTLQISAGLGEPEGNLSLRVAVSREGKAVAEKEGSSSGFVMSVEDAKLWSPADPFLYDLKIDLLGSDGSVVDSVDSYVGFRTVGKEQDEAGNWRLTLNGDMIFHWGPLDQGWWPDGLLTPPSDQAMQFEINYLRDAGFNMLRKHIKVEPRRYYYHCDRIGIMVWQDQPSGGSGEEWPKWKRFIMPSAGERRPQLHQEGDPLDAVWPDWAHEQFMVELKGLVDNLYNHPSIVVWVPFNERWGQHRTMEVGEWVNEYDPSRSVNIASGGNFFPVGDIADGHNYPDAKFPLDEVEYDEYVRVVGEFGGHGWPVEGHLWDPNKSKYVYGNMPQSIDEYKSRYVSTARQLGDLRDQGIAAGVYTQTTDVEGELNGLLTYDRKVVKMPAARLREIHAEAGLPPSD